MSATSPSVVAASPPPSSVIKKKKFLVPCSCKSVATSYATLTSSGASTSALAQVGVATSALAASTAAASEALPIDSGTSTGLPAIHLQLQETPFSPPPPPSNGGAGHLALASLAQANASRLQQRSAALITPICTASSEGPHHQ